MKFKHVKTCFESKSKTGVKFFLYITSFKCEYQTRIVIQLMSQLQNVMSILPSTGRFLVQI